MIFSNLFEVNVLQERKGFRELGASGHGVYLREQRITDMERRRGDN